MIQADMPFVRCGPGKKTTPNPYNSKDVLLPYMRDPKMKDRCRLRKTSSIVFHTLQNRCQVPSKKGQCTEWSDGRYYQITGVHVEFDGPASSWPAQARRNPKKWRVSTKPLIPSIVILPPGMYGSASTGHSAVLESKFPSGHICTSNWNAPTRGRLSLWKIMPKPGVIYIALRGKQRPKPPHKHKLPY
ncbi:hypothetical protein DSO57_1016997 [Entomophthora muscae]|uniref:Uncharacterized protein n=1 Tax=Entomophthora muscae TaxID=34485 RepID=A0ACC2RJD5_9FUNG|nr:hypothetical protein DSO57_1016997 [Entomophthora muscae]